MAKMARARNKKMSFFIRLGPFGVLKAFRLEPNAKKAGRGGVGGAVLLFWRRVGGGGGGKGFGDVQGEQGGEKIEERGKGWGARGGMKPPIMVLQTIALPLGDRAFGRNEIW